MTPIEEIREADARVEAIQGALREARAKRAELGRREALKLLPNFHGKRVRDNKGRVFELLLVKADVITRVPHEGAEELVPSMDYKQIQVRKDGGYSKAGASYCFALDWSGRKLRNGSYEWMPSEKEE